MNSDVDEDFGEDIVTLRDRTLYVVGIGASAGGLEALRALLSNLPTDADMCYVVAQHLDPKHQSLLTTLLGRETTLAVAEATDGQELIANHIFVCPANADVMVRDGHLVLRPPRHAIGPKPSVDMFLASLADDAGEKAVAIILSGTGSDGAHGIRAVRAAGGITIAQDPVSAKYNGMPVSAIDTGAVDFVLPPDKIARELASLCVFPRRLHMIGEPTGKALSAYDRILMHIKKKVDVDFSDYKSSTLLRRIQRRMAAHRIDEIEDYAAFLEATRGEADLLYNDILISVTAFFRDKEAFQALSKVIQKIIEGKKPGDAIRIWVPGCATGEEVYSIAILLVEQLGAEVSSYAIQVFGTDLDVEATSAARKGIYSPPSVENIDDHLLNRYFLRLGANYQVSKRVRDLTIFAKQDLIKDPPFLRIDMVSCRNLLIYFNAKLQKRVFELFHYVLVPGGYMFLGKSEAIGQFADLFESVNKKWRIFRRKGVPSVGGMHRLLDSRSSRPPLELEAATREREPSVTEVMERLLLDTYAPPSVVVDQAMEIIHIHGDVAPFLQLKPGRAGLNVVALAKDPLRSSLRALLYKAFREKIQVFSQRQRLTPKDDDLVRILVQPLEVGDNTRAVVVFERSHLAEGAASPSSSDPTTDFRLTELEQELAATREHLQTVIEELETSNEELQSVNEEMQASNEELQSSNEELETSNEELQSTNEELMTVNEELQIKSSELASANADLENIQNTVGLALIMVDKNLRVMRYTPLAPQILSIVPGDIGHVITAIPCHIELPNLRQELTEVITTGRMVEALAIHGDGRIYDVKMFPYYSEHRDVAGAVITFHDRTELEAARHLYDDGARLLNLVYKVANLAYWDLDVDSGKLTSSAHLEGLFGLEPGELDGTQSVLLERIHPADRANVAKLMADARAGSSFTLDHRILDSDGAVHWVSHACTAMGDREGGEPTRMVGVIANIDNVKRAEKQIHRETVLLDMVDEPVAILDGRGVLIRSNVSFTERFGDNGDVVGRPFRSFIGCHSCAAQQDCPVNSPGEWRCTAITKHACTHSGATMVIHPVLDDNQLFDSFLVRVAKDES